MSIEDRNRWDQRHRNPATLKARPSVLALPRVPRTPAVALDLACGQGRHSRALLQAGYQVVAMDVSMRGLRHLHSTTHEKCSTEILLVQADADAWPLAAGVFDLVVQVDFLERALFATLRASLRSGGLLLIDTFMEQGRPNAEGPTRRDFLLEAGELPRAFAEFELLQYDERRGDTARATMLARKR
ncbi:MAG: class I SAM-dependent methyltransferase [Candidatus Binatia bacterium]